MIHWYWLSYAAGAGLVIGIMVGAAIEHRRQVSVSLAAAAVIETAYDIGLLQRPMEPPRP